MTDQTKMAESNIFPGQGNTSVPDMEPKKTENISESGNFQSPAGDLPTRSLTFGEETVGLDFNPSKNPKVDKAKRLCADLLDLINDENETRSKTQNSQRIFSHAVGEILNAQMNAVKFLTLKS